MLVMAMNASAQPADVSPPKNSIFYGFSERDSIIVYQCHVEKVKQSLTTASGQTFSASEQSVTITEKYVLYRKGDQYRYNYYTTGLNVFPNKKFSGLKIRERPYWQFQLAKSGAFTDRELLVFLALEKRGREAMEFDYGISRYNTNQVIFKRGRDFRQLVIDTDHVISRLLHMP